MLAAERRGAKTMPPCGRVIDGEPCPRKRRKAAAACQKCIDREEAAKKALERPRKMAKDWRRSGWLVLIWKKAFVVLAPIAEVVKVRSCRITPIDEGRWGYAVDPAQPPWRSLSDAECLELGPHIKRILQVCYCPSFPTTGCDFCNGLRSPDEDR